MKLHNKISLIAGLVGALAGSGAYAQTSVSVYGLIDAFAGSRQLSGGTKTNVVNDGGLSTSHFGFRGSEDLGDGLKANFEIAGFFGSDTGNSGRFSGDPMFARRAAVGLSGNFGQVDLGRGSTPYFLSLIMFNPLGDSSGFSPIFLHTYTGGQFPISSPPLNAEDSGMSNMIQYTTPSFNGLKATIQYGMGEVAGDSSKNRISASANYFNGPLGLSFAYERSSTSLGTLGTLPNPETKQSSFMGGVSYDFGVAKLFAQYEQTTQEFAAAGTDRKYTTWQLGTSVPVSAAGKVLLSWANTKIDLPAGVSPYTVVPGFPALPAGVATSGVNPTRNTVTLGYDHNLSKRTDLYALFMNDKYADLPSGTSLGLGIRHRF